MRTEVVKNMPTTDVLVSHAPLLQPKEGAKARRDADKFVLSRPDAPLYSDSLSLAVALSLYNARNARTASQTERKMLEEQAKERVTTLVEAETTASKNGNFLPTIGIEVEVPDIPMRYDHDATIYQYAAFFDAIGMPRNRSNRQLADMSSHWEFSPKPSYSATTQARILSELIQGGFIPHLENSKSPKHVREHLDPNLVSLHINIGTPLHFNQHDNEGKDILAKALAIAYTSPLRLEHRKTKGRQFADVRQGSDLIPLTKDIMWGISRIELRGMEVLDSQTYRALYASQALFGLYFLAFKEEKHSQALYENLIQDIKKVAADAHYFFPSVNDYHTDAYEISRVAGREHTAANMRNVINRYKKKVLKMLPTNSEALQLPQENEHL